MKIYTFGKKENPVVMLLPGTCCHWKSFEGVIPKLSENFYVLCVSYDGFDETEHSAFVSMQDEAEKIEDCIKENLNGEIRTVYGCSLGGTLAAMLAERGNVRIRHAVIGSSDFDTCGEILARLETKLMVKMIYPLLATGRMHGILGKIMDRKMAGADGYMKSMMKMFGVGSTKMRFVTKESVANQFYSDLVTRLPYKMDTHGTKISIFYAAKMGKKYLKRYHKYFDSPKIYKDNLRHEELLVCYPDQWVGRVSKIVRSK